MTRSGGPSRFDDPDAVADAIIARVGKDIVLALPLGLGKANHVANALFARAAADPSIRLRIFTALTLEKPRGRGDLERRFVQPFCERVFAGYPDLAYATALHAGRLPSNIQVDEFFFQAGTRLGIAASQQNYICANYTHALRYVIERGVNVVAQLVAARVGGAAGFSLSCNPDLTLDLLAERERGRCDFLFAGQVNSELPFMPGDAELAEREFDLLLEGPATDFALFGAPREPVDLAEYAAGIHVARTIADGGTLQLGIGSLGDAVAQALILRHRSNPDFRRMVTRLDPAGSAPAGLRESAPFQAGLHGVSEMFVEGFLDLRRAGILTREVDGALLQAAFFLGSRAFYRALREMPDGGARKAAHDRGFVRQRALRRRGRQAPRAGESALHQQCHDGDLARRRGFRRPGKRPGRQRRRRAVQFRGAELRAGGRPLDHHAAGGARGEAAHDLEHPLELRPHHHSAPSARRRGDGIRDRGLAREERSGRDRGDARGRRFPLPGRTAAQCQGCRQDRAQLRAARALPRQHA